MPCGGSLNARSPDGSEALFGTTCVPAGWTGFQPTDQSAYSLRALSTRERGRRDIGRRREERLALALALPRSSRFATEVERLHAGLEPLRR